jgi:hypothetical protein
MHKQKNDKFNYMIFKGLGRNVIGQYRKMNEKQEKYLHYFKDGRHISLIIDYFKNKGKKLKDFF